MSQDRNAILQSLLELDSPVLYSSDAQRFAMEQLLSSILKKNVDHIAPSADESAKQLFLTMNSRCKAWKPKFDEVEFQVFSRAKEVCRKLTTNEWQDSFSLSAIHKLGAFGPGASRMTRQTSFIGKIGDSRLSCSSRALTDVWSNCVKGSVRQYLSEVERVRRFGPVARCNSSKTSFVPKSREISRMIATEPSVNMYYQIGLGRCLEKSLTHHYNMNIKHQQAIARKLCRSGSKSGLFATIDLKSASDTISCRLVHMLFPPSFTLLSDLFRVKYTEVGGETTKLSTYSTMGNGFTFPLQTCVFLAVVVACYELLGINVKRPRYSKDGVSRLGNFSVYGDDIIVDHRAYRLVCKCLISLGCVPNVTKSFNEGPFRESCGGDYYNGSHVRGVYNKTLRKPHAIYSTINQLILWSYRHGIFLEYSMGYLFSLVRKRRIPYDFDLSWGIFANDYGKRDGNGTMVSNTMQIRKITKSINRFSDRPNCVMHSALGGYLRGGKITERLQGDVSYHSVPIAVPSPGYLSGPVRELFHTDWEEPQSFPDWVDLYWASCPMDSNA